MFDSLRLLLSQLIALGQARMELLTTELPAEVQRISRALIAAGVALLFGSLGMLMIGATIIIASWQHHRVLAASLVTAGFLGVAGVAAWYAWRSIERSTDLRGHIAANAEETTSRLRLGDPLESGARAAMQRPALVAGAALLVLCVGRSRAARLASRALVVVGLLRRLSRLSGALKP